MCVKLNHLDSCTCPYCLVNKTTTRLSLNPMPKGAGPKVKNLSDVPPPRLSQTERLNKQRRDLHRQSDSNWLSIQADYSKGVSKQTEIIRNQVCRSFIHHNHFDAITRASLQHKFTVSFREAGEHTLRAVGLHAPMKGHDILEKTIKRSSLSSAYPNNGEHEFSVFEDAGLLGLVGHWGSGDESGVQGIYCVSKSSQSPQIKSLYDENKNLITIQDVTDEDGRLMAYTGDYDLHDMITHRSGRPRTVLSDSKEEKGIIDQLNQAIADVDPKRPFHDVEYNPIRHGPQVNFVSHMMFKESAKVEHDSGVLRVVAEPGPFPIAVVSKGTWSIIQSAGELKRFYRSIGAVMKETWDPDGVRKFSGNGQYVSLKRNNKS